MVKPRVEAVVVEAVVTGLTDGLLPEACAAVDEAFRTVRVGDARPRRFATSKRFELVREAEQEIDRSLDPGESRVDFILKSVRAELDRREKAKP